MTIEERLENMERELGRVKCRNRWLLGSILLVAGGLIAPGMFETTAVRAQTQKPGTAEQIRATGFILEDAKGMIRGALTVAEFGPNLVLFDENGKLRTRLAADNEGPTLTLYDENEKDRARLWASKDGPTLSLWDEKGTARSDLAVDKSGPRLSLWTEDGSNLLLSAIKEVGSGLVLSSQKDGAGVGLWALKESRALSLYDENKQYRAGLWTGKDGSNLVLADENGKNRFIAGKTKTATPDGKVIEYPESSLILFGPDGKVIWSAIR